MKFGKKHAQDDTPEPVGVEALSGASSAPAQAQDATTRLPEGVPSLTVLSADAITPNPYAAGEPGAGNAGGAGWQAAGSANPEALLDPEERQAYARLKAMRAERRKKKLVRRGIACGVVVALVAALGIWRAASNQQAFTGEAPVITQPLTRGPFVSEITGTGSIKPASSQIVQPQIDGVIESVNVVAGQQVSEGDVLFTIKNDELDRAVKEAERGVSSANASYNQAVSQRDAAKRAWSQAQALPQDPESGESPAASAKQALDDAQLQVDSTALQVEAAKDALAQAQDSAAQRTVKAPITGSILELNATPGASLSQAAASAANSGSGSGALCQIADLSQMTVTVQVSEADINKVSVDQAASATFTAVPDATLDATVRAIASVSSDEGYGGYGYGSGVTYAVDLVIPNPDPRLKPGMTANVSIVTESIDSALLVPLAALADNGDGTGTITVETDAEAHTGRVVSVNVLATNGGEAAVEPAAGESLSEGDSVVVAGFADTDDAMSDDAMGEDGSVTDGSGGAASSSSSSSDTVVEHGVDGAGNPVA